MKKSIQASVVLVVVFSLALPEMLHVNSGISTSEGYYSNGHMENAYLLPFEGENFTYFSFISYYLMDNAYLNSSVCKTITDAYAQLHAIDPHASYRVMEIANQEGGSMLLHRTHQLGMSADFMVPLKDVHTGQQVHLYDRTGLLHYLLDFKGDGSLNFDKGTAIDFEKMARHLLALSESAEKNGLKIEKVIFNVALQKKLFSTPSGKILASKDIYFYPKLRPFIDKLHDDHYHVDFVART